MNVYQHNINTITGILQVYPDIRLVVTNISYQQIRTTLYIQFPPCKVVALNKSSIFMVFSSIDNYIDTFFSNWKY